MTPASTASTWASFLLNRDPRGTTRTRIVPLLLWPLKLQLEVGSRGQVALAFDGEREEVRLNPALESLLGPEPCKRWRKVADELLGRSALRRRCDGCLRPARHAAC